MKIFKTLEEFHAPSSSFALTIGNFDGVHLGHQAILHHLKQRAAHSVVLTFSNHPIEVLYQSSFSRLTTLSHRLALFERHGIDTTVLIPFTYDFSLQPAKLFLSHLKKRIPFSHLILGHDAMIGNDRVKDLSKVAQELRFALEYLEPVQKNQTIVSSSKIRKAIETGNLEAAGELLGRPYSIFATVEKGFGTGKALGFHTANLPVADLALPPLGVYAVKVSIDKSTHLAVANLGRAPTFHQNRPPLLEVHLIDDRRDLYGKELEVFFLKYLRPEKAFSNAEALKKQIQKDIQQTLAIQVSTNAE